MGVISLFAEPPSGTVGVMHEKLEIGRTSGHASPQLSEKGFATNGFVVPLSPLDLKGCMNPPTGRKPTTARAEYTRNDGGPGSEFAYHSWLFHCNHLLYTLHGN